MKKVMKKKKRGTNLEASRRVFEGIDSSSKFFKVQPGENRIRLLPSNREDGAIAVAGVQHFGFKIDGKLRAFPCMSTLKKPCPVCKLISHHDSDTDPDVQDMLKNIRPTRFWLFNMIDRKNVGAGVLILSAGVMIARGINDFLNDDEYGDITDPESGRDIKITKTGDSQFTTRYSTKTAASPSEIGDDVDWQDTMHNLEKERYREIPSQKKYLEYIELCLGNVLDVEGALGTKSKKDDEETEEDEDEDMEEDDDNDEDEEEESDEEDEDEDEEDEVESKQKKVKKPAKKKLLKKKKSRNMDDL